jgi:hypothetical protein
MLAKNERMILLLLAGCGGYKNLVLQEFKFFIDFSSSNRTPTPAGDERRGTRPQLVNMKHCAALHQAGRPEKDAEDH